jgi:hypothetical protein
MCRTPCCCSALIDFVVLMLAAEAAGCCASGRSAARSIPLGSGRLPHMLTFAVTLQLAMVGVGVYAVDSLHGSMRIAVARLVVAISLGVLLLALIFFLVPALTFWRSNLLYAMIFALGGLVAVRADARPTLARRGVQAPRPGPRRRPARRAARASWRRATAPASRSPAMSHERRRGRRRRRGQPRDIANLPIMSSARRERGGAGAGGAAQRAAARTICCASRRPASTSTNFLLPRARDRPRRSRQPQPSWLIFSDGFSAGRRLSSAASGCSTSSSAPHPAASRRR